MLVRHSLKILSSGRWCSEPKVYAKVCLPLWPQGEVKEGFKGASLGVDIEGYVHFKRLRREQSKTGHQNPGPLRPILPITRKYYWSITGNTEITESITGVTDFIYLCIYLFIHSFIYFASKITADGDCSHEIKRRLLLGRKVMTNLDNILKSRDITLPTKVCLV